MLNILKRLFSCFGSTVRVDGTLSNDDGDVNENFKEAISLDWAKKTSLHVHHAFLYIALT